MYVKSLSKPHVLPGNLMTKDLIKRQKIFEFNNKTQENMTLHLNGETYRYLCYLET